MLLCAEAAWLSPGRVRSGTAHHGLFYSWSAVVCSRHRALGHTRAHSPQRVGSQNSRRKDTDRRYQVNGRLLRAIDLPVLVYVREL